MSESPFSPSNHCFRINKTDRSHSLNFSSSSASSPVAKKFTATTNTIPKPGLFIPGRDSIKHTVKTGTSLVGEKFSFNNERSLTQIEPNLVIQTDASKSG